MNEIIAAIGSFVRHGVGTLGGGLVANGYATDSDVQMLAGGAAVLFSILASFVRNRLLKKKIAG